MNIEQKKELVEQFNTTYSHILHYSSCWDGIDLESGDVSLPIDYDGITTVEELKERVIEAVVSEKDYCESKVDYCNDILDLWR